MGVGIASSTNYSGVFLSKSVISLASNWRIIFFMLKLDFGSPIQFKTFLLLADSHVFAAKSGQRVILPIPGACGTSTNFSTVRTCHQREATVDIWKFHPPQKENESTKIPWKKNRLQIEDDVVDHLFKTSICRTMMIQSFFCRHPGILNDYETKHIKLRQPSFLTKFNSTSMISALHPDNFAATTTTTTRGRRRKKKTTTRIIYTFTLDLNSFTDVWSCFAPVFRCASNFGTSRITS